MFHRNVLLFANCILFISSSASAAENTAISGTPTAAAQASAGSASSSLPDAPDLKKARALLAPQKIELFRTTVKETTQEKGLFARLFASGSNPIDAELLAEMQQFTEWYASLPQTDEVFHLKAQVHKRMKNYHAAALNWMLLKVMYPQSTLVAAANKQLKELGDDQLEKQAAIIDKLNKKIASLSGDMDQRTGVFIEFLGTFRDETFAASIAAEGASFLARNETFQSEDMVESAIAHQAMLFDNDVALYRFNKLLALYPASNFRADSLLSIASIQRGKLKLYDKAAKTFMVLIEKHPDSNEAKSGYEALATMYNEDMHDYPNAIKTYDAIIAKYKNDPVVLRALLAMEQVYETKTGQADKAIDTYLKLADIFDKGQEGLNALISAEKIAVNSTKNWAQAIAINDRIIARVPNTEDAIKAMYSTADLTDTRMGDKEKAKELYQNFIKEHSDHQLAKEAQKRIDAMMKK
ncbi:MAG: tetratricopeptide repeat protein [Gallionellaceae bacterium]|nr:MAG: tetratricopeptide repeat protein [Gallionellaceae bacterium]